MRYINLDHVRMNLHDKWLEKAKGALQAVEHEPPAKRGKKINNRSHIWSKLKDVLMEASHGKCWYCECKRRRDYYAVDHFRPKNAVVERPDHEGYWWLAFEWRNYRFSCSYCNSGITDPATSQFVSKGAHFPILDETRRIMTRPDNLDVLEEEQATLLDPTKPADVGLLLFNQNGDAVPRYSANATSRWEKRGHERAATSIKLYNLNYETTKEERKELYNEIEKQVRRVDRYLKRESPDEVLLDDLLNEVFGKLMSVVGEKAEYSAARAYIMSLRPNHDWLEFILTAC